MTQLSLFGAPAREPALRDLEGLLAAGAHTVRRPDAARLSVVVAEQWRAQALALDLAAGLAIEAELTPVETGTVVATPWLAALRPLIDDWSLGAVCTAPAGWVLDGARLRWWCIAGGRAGHGVYTLAVGSAGAGSWAALGAALAGAGVSGVFVGARSGGPAYRVVGRRRLARLVELVGDPPPGVPAQGWPTLQGPA